MNWLLTHITPSIAHAADTAYVPLVLEGLSIEGGDLTGFINNLFDLAVLLASVLAVILIAFYGLQYMTTEAVGKTINAKIRIGQIIMGILMLLGIWVFFNQINPDILTLRIELLNQPGGSPQARTVTSGRTNSNGVIVQQNNSVPTFRGVGAQSLGGSTLHRVNSKSALRGICGKAAQGFICGYTSLAQCQRALFTDSGCKEYTGTDQALLQQYVKICTQETAAGCTGLLSIYGSFTIGVDPENNQKRIASFFKDRASCVAAYGPECEQEPAVTAQWEELMASGRYTMHVHYTPKFLNDTTVEVVEQPDLGDAQTEPYIGQSGKVVRSFISADGSIRYIVALPDNAEENFAEGALQDPSTTP